MTEFRFHLWNHTDLGRRSLEDVIGIIGKQMRALGHQAGYIPEDSGVARSIEFIGRDRGYNVVVEGFTPSIVEVIAKAHAHGARFICLATEEPTEQGFNHGTQREMRWRQEIFPAAMPHFDGILHLVPGEAATRWYSQFAPAAQVELGYAPELVMFNRKNARRDPEYEFGFFGSLSKRRHKILRRLADLTGVRNAVRVVMDFPSQNERDAAMQNVKVVVQLRKFDEMGLVSSSRCNTALCNGRPVVAEPHDVALSKPWDEIVTFTRTLDDFYLQAMLTRQSWQETHRVQLERFARLLPPEVCVGRALRAIGVDAPRREAA
jgi:hypothetical protein